jgi:hypothetical protein
MAPKRTTRRQRLAELNERCEKTIIAGAMKTIDDAYKQGRYQDALDGLILVKSIHNVKGESEAENMIDTLISNLIKTIFKK